MKRWFRFPSRWMPLTCWSVSRLSVGPAGVVLLMVSMTASTGCDSGSFIPPPPDELRDNALAPGGPASGSAPSAADWLTEPAETKAIELILDRRETEDEAVVTTAARTQAGLDRVKLKIAVVGEKDIPARQVDLAREALAGHPLALIVEPADPTDRRLAQVIDEARAAKVPVVLLSRPVAGMEGAAPNPADTKAPTGKAPAQPGAGQGAATVLDPGSRKAIVLVKPPSFASSAQQLVASAIRNAKNAKLDPQGGAVILVNTIGDQLIPERALAIRKALEAAGVKTIQEVSFAKPELGGKHLTERLEANRKLVLVFSVDSPSSMAGKQVMTEIVVKRPFILAGYAADDSYSSSTQIGDFAAVAEYVPARLVRKAVNTAAALAQGRDVPSVYELPIIVHDSPEDSKTAKSPTFYKNKKAEQKKGS